MNLKSIVTVTALLISSCGWQLRGQEELDTPSASIFISSNIPNRPYVEHIKRFLDTFGYKTQRNAENADLGVVLINSREDTRISSLNASARAAEYMLTKHVDFIITDSKGDDLTKLVTVSVERIYEFDEQDILASSNEERRIRNEMHQDIAKQIHNRLRSLSNKRNLTNSSSGDE